MFTLDRVKARQITRLRCVPQVFEGGVLFVGRDQCRQRAVARPLDLGPGVVASFTIQGTRVGRMKIVGAKLARQRDARDFAACGGNRAASCRDGRATVQ